MPESTPRIDVIIAAHNEQQFLAPVLQALWSQDYPHRQLRIIVADNFSSDNTVAVAREHGATVLTLPGTVAELRNIAISDSEADYIGIIGTHTVVENGWLKKMLRHFENPKCGACGGTIDYICTNPEARTLVASSIFASAQDQFEHTSSGLMGAYPWVSAGNAMFRRRALADAGLFNEALADYEDVDLSWRIVLKGYELEFEPDARATFYDDAAWWQFMMQQYQRGLGSAQVAYMHGMAQQTENALNPAKSTGGRWHERLLSATMYKFGYWRESRRLSLRQKSTEKSNKIEKLTFRETLGRLRPSRSWNDKGMMLSLSREVVYWLTNPGMSVLVHVPAGQRYIFQGIENTLFRALARGQDRNALIRILTENYGVTAETAARQVDIFVGELHGEHLVAFNAAADAERSRAANMD